MARLHYADLQAVLDFLGDAEAVRGTEPFPPPLLEGLYRLVPGDGVSYCELDCIRRQVLVLDSWPGSDPSDSDVVVETFWRLFDQHPLCHSVLSGADFCALRMSDVVTRRALHRTEIYAEFFAAYECEYLLKLRLPSPEWHTKTFLFGRGRDARDFSLRDRAVLDALRPHFARFYEDAVARRRAAAALAAFDEVANTQGAAALVLVGPDGHVERATAGGRELLREYFGGRGRLPQELAAWLGEPGREPFVTEGRQGRLTVRCVSSDVLLLENDRRDASVCGLTRREWEVMRLVAQGRSNAEIARELWVAPSTVRKHLENIYGKLGVTSRTAALARLHPHVLPVPPPRGANLSA